MAFWQHHHTIKCGLILKLLPKVFWIEVWSEFYPLLMAGAEVCWLNQTMNWQFKSVAHVWGRSWGRGSTCLPSVLTQCPRPPAIMDLCLSDHETYDIWNTPLKRYQRHWHTLPIRNNFDFIRKGRKAMEALQSPVIIVSLSIANWSFYSMLDLYTI